MPHRGLKAKSRQAEVILVKDAPGLGLKGDVVKVKPGYARNFLIPQQLGVYAVQENREFFGIGAKVEGAAVQANEQNMRELEIRKFMRQFSWRLNKLELLFVRPKGADSNELTTNVTRAHVLEKVISAGFIGLTEESFLMDPIRKVGKYRVAVQMNKGWVLPGLGLFGELERLENVVLKNPEIKLVVEAKVVLTKEEKLLRAEQRKRDRELRKASQEEEDQRKEEEDKAKAKEKAKEKSKAAKGAKK